MIGIIGPTNDPTRTLVTDQLTATNEETTVSTDLPSDTSPYSALYLIGTHALSHCATARPDCPLIPINTPPLPTTLPPDRVHESIQHLETGEFTRVTPPTISLTQANHPITTGLFDLFVTATQVAEITTFTIHTDTLDTQFRADGIAIGTPLGTHDYLTAAGAPLVDYDTNALVAIPLAQFDLQKTHWVFSPDTTITIEINQAPTPMNVLTDGISTHPIEKNQPITVSLTDPLSLITFPTLTND